MAAQSPWPVIHAERAALADDLAALTDEQWAMPSLCGDWTVRQDTDWSAGSGPVVSGPAVSLVLAITGRTVALADLSGDGLAALRSRG
jgi:hypothetical protein